jgi:UDP-N-acetylmuramate dehydrogenase
LTNRAPFTKSTSWPLRIENQKRGMDEGQKETLRRLGGPRVHFRCSMAPYTTYRVGGEVETLYEAHDVVELCRLLSFLNEESIPYLVVGCGSNLLVKDSGLKGVAILLRGSLAALEEASSGRMTLVAGAGLSLTELLIHCRLKGLSGLEFLAGIPGTVGGALAMNAGAFGEEMGSRVQEVQMVKPEGAVVVRERSQLTFAYRSLAMEPGWVIIGARLVVDSSEPHLVAGRITELLKRRRASQPIRYPSAGSVFKNPPGDFAGRLIENAGLKGKRMGGAMVSPEHANYIVNTGGATAGDILALVEMVREKVRQETGVWLDTEIRVVGL